MEIINGGASFDLAIVDFWLDGTDSVSLFDALQSERPGLPFIMMTGGSGDFPIEMSHGIARVSGASEFLQKPFRRAQLLSLVERLLSTSNKT